MGKNSADLTANMSHLEENSCLVSTPIYYVNASPHLGHFYGTVVADFIHRFEKMTGKRSFFLTGTDEHGEKIEASAQKKGITPQEFTNAVSKEFSESWKELKLNFDKFYRTTDPKHIKLVQNVLQNLKDKGDIYQADYEGNYCVGCERYLKDTELNNEGFCPDHLKKPDARKESGYFFKMEKYQEKLVEHYHQNNKSIVPSHFKKEILSMLQEPIGDLSISRPKSRTSWGIELPFDSENVTYVWFDALLNYLGGIGYDGNENINFDCELWAGSQHVIGKDILKTHAIYWPCMLLSMEMALPKKIITSGHWQVKKLKMSKSIGNVIEPVSLCKEFGTDPVRYFLLSEMSFGMDASFSQESLVQKANSDLANGLGNLTSRSLTLLKKNFEFKIPAREEENPLLEKMKECAEKVLEEWKESRYHIGCQKIMESVQHVDRYINEKEPWKLAKVPEKREELAAVLRNTFECLCFFSRIFYPLCPEKAVELHNALGLKDEPMLWENLFNFPGENHLILELPRLFPRLEIKVEA